MNSLRSGFPGLYLVVITGVVVGSFVLTSNCSSWEYWLALSMCFLSCLKG